MVAVASMSVFGLILSQSDEARRIDAYLVADAREHGVLLDRTLELEGASLEVFAKDYSNWGEMVQFVQTGDSTWASVNIDEGMGIYRADAAWVFDTAGSLVYAVRDSALEALLEPVPPGFPVKDAFSDGHLCYFFIAGPDGPVEIRGATIVPSDDAERKTPARGYFLAARLWNRQYLAGLTRLTGKTVRIEPARTGTKPSTEIVRQSGEITFTRPLPGPQGKPELMLTASLRPGWIALARRTGRDLLAHLTTPALLGTLLLTLALWLWVTRPLGRIARSLESGTAETLKPLERSRTEFGLLARLVGQFFAQNAALVREVTERKQAEVALRESEERLGTITGAAKDAIIMINDFGLVTFWNPAAEAMFGYAANEVLGRNLHGFLAPERFRATHVAAFGRFRATGEGGAVGKTLELAAVRKDGSEIPVELSMSAVASGDKWHAIGIMRDITERKQAEDALAHKNTELAALNEQKNQFLGMAAHDLRNPLAVILNYSEFILGGDVGAMTPEQTKFIATMKRSSEFMLKLVNDLLDVAKIEAGKVNLELEPTDLAALLTENIALNRVIVEKKGIRLELEVAADLPKMELDPAKIEQVLNNLVSNAVKFSNPGGIVSVRATRVNGTVSISVADRGPGIPPDELGRLFTAFGRTSVRSTSGEKDTGLGLLIVKRILEAHRGGIRVESEPGKGTTFVVTLPGTKPRKGPEEPSTARDGDAVSSTENSGGENA
jgi:PAS domain S-box-containing protein